MVLAWKTTVGVPAEDDRALLAAAAEDWERISRDPEALATYRSDTDNLVAFEPAMPEY